jgi:Fur family peroxide stress response transcriptional regulator
MKEPGTRIAEKLKSKGLKVTPQRVAVLEAVNWLDNHPTADQIITYIKRTHPNIATGTVYKVLDVLVENNLVKKVKTDRDIMRYDGMMENHHHIYCAESERIADYMDEDLDHMLQEYFQHRKIAGFTIEEIRLQIKGKFIK